MASHETGGNGSVDVFSGSDWLTLIAIGGVVGAVGQGLRIVVGIKKLSDEAAAKGETVSDLISPSKMVVSLIVGFIVGALTAIVTHVPGGKFSMQSIIALVGAGYAGTDAIEGLFSRFIPAGGSTSSNPGSSGSSIPPDADEPSMG